MPYNPVYAATKSAVIQFSRSLSNLFELENIKVCAFFPTYALTPLTAGEHAERMKKAIGGEMLTADVVAQGTLFLMHCEAPE